MTGLLALGAKLALASSTYGTNDVEAWKRFTWVIRTYGGARLYERDPVFNHPPFMVHVLAAMGWLTDRHWMPFQFWLRLPAIVADFGSLFVVHRIASRLALALADARVRTRDLCLLAAAPISLFVSGFHGNTDPVMLFFLLASVLFVDAPRRIWLAGAAFGMSVNIKVVPLMFLPAVLLYLPTMRKRLEFACSAALVVFALSQPVLMEVPGVIAHRVLGYGSKFGVWGLARIATSLPETSGMAELLQGYGLSLLVAVLVVLALWMNLGRAKPSLYRQLGVTAFAALSVSPAFGVQYTAWLVPWIVGMPLAAALAFHLANGVFLFSVYTYWSRGFPWGFADSETVGVWKGSIVPVELVAWASVVAMFALLVRAAAAEKRMLAGRKP